MKAYGVRQRVGMGHGFDAGGPGPGKPGEELGKETGSPPGGPGGFAPWWQAVTFSPKLPEPYETWDSAQACVHFVED